MAASVKPSTNFGIAKRRDDLRLQFMASEMARQVGQRIKERRLELKLKQRELAALLGEPVNDQRISDWERGVNEPSDRYKKKLVTALQLEELGGISYFYTEAPGTPDLMGTLSPTKVQLDRIERKLNALLRLAGAEVTDLFAPDDDTQAVPPTARGHARARTRGPNVPKAPSA